MLLHAYYGVGRVVPSRGQLKTAVEMLWAGVRSGRVVIRAWCSRTYRRQHGVEYRSRGRSFSALGRRTNCLEMTAGEAALSVMSAKVVQQILRSLVGCGSPVEKSRRPGTEGVGAVQDALDVVGYMLAIKGEM
jgi:hypothetical protein